MVTVVTVISDQCGLFFSNYYKIFGRILDKLLGEGTIPRVIYIYIFIDGNEETANIAIVEEKQSVGCLYCSSMCVINN